MIGHLGLVPESFTELLSRIGRINPLLVNRAEYDAATQSS